MTSTNYSTNDITCERHLMCLLQSLVISSERSNVLETTQNEAVIVSN